MRSLKSLAVAIGVMAAAGGSVAQAADCPILESANWTAWIDAMPGVGAVRTLHVTGEVVLPTPGFEQRWTLGPADRRLIPSQLVTLEFTPPEGVVAQVLETLPVAFETEAIYPQYASIKIRCGESLIVEITEIAEVQ